MQIINIPHMTVLEGYGHKGEHIFKAATTCYKSEDKITEDSWVLSIR